MAWLLLYWWQLESVEQIDFENTIGIDHVPGVMVN